MPSVKPRIILTCIPLLLLLGLSRVCAEDSVPPLKDGTAPTHLDALWGNYDPRLEPLEVEILKEWEADGVVCRLLRYQVGIFKGAPVKMAAFYAFPKGGTKLPAILEMHGGGQSAGLDGVVADAKNGYAGISINWGGNKLNFGRSKMTYDGPQTDWGKLDATHPPQRNKANHFAGSLAPDEYTLDTIESPRNSNWFLVLVAARRAITFLEQQPEVDPARIGASGHSMGGKLTTDLAGIDRRVKAAVPSCGGAGIILESQADELPGCVTSKPSAMELNCVADNAYLPRISCPILWLSPSNDFHGTINNMAWNWRTLPDSLVAFSIAPHLNHRHTAPHAITRLLWFERYLKGACILPGTPRLQLDLATKTGVPGVTVTPDQPASVKSVEIYYSIGLNDKIRFWREANEIKNGNVWSAACPVMSVEDPVFIYANVSYATQEKYQNSAVGEVSDWFTISSRMLTATSVQLKKAGVKATDLPDRMIDDGSRGWADWFQLNWGHPPLWSVTTRKLTDPKWRGPDGAKLVFETRCESDNTLVIKFNCNGWGAYQPGRPAVDYVAVKELKGSADWQSVSVAADDTVALDPAITGPIPNWQTVTEFSLGPTGETVKNGAKVTVGGKAWTGPRVIRNLHWEGGVDETRQPADSK
jgi:pimeloyl-ACP methyl ester carboxylesterase